MNIAELLKELFNATDEQVEAFAGKMKENKIFTAGEENLDVRYGKLKTEHESRGKELEQANALIAEMKKANKGNEEMQGKITAYESQVEQLKAELATAKLEAAVKVGLLAEKATDIDYLTFKLKEKGELELDENEKVKGWNDKIAALKTQFPNQFESSGTKKVEERKLDRGDDSDKMTRSELLKKPYAERMKVYNENPEAYHEIMKG